MDWLVRSSGLSVAPLPNFRWHAVHPSCPTKTELTTPSPHQTGTASEMLGYQFLCIFGACLPRSGLHDKQISELCDLPESPLACSPASDEVLPTRLEWACQAIKAAILNTNTPCGIERKVVENRTQATSSSAMNAADTIGSRKASASMCVPEHARSPCQLCRAVSLACLRRPSKVMLLLLCSHSDHGGPAGIPESRFDA